MMGETSTRVDAWSLKVASRLKGELEVSGELGLMLSRPTFSVGWEVDPEFRLHFISLPRLANGVGASAAGPAAAAWASGEPMGLMSIYNRPISHTPLHPPHPHPASVPLSLSRDSARRDKGKSSSSLLLLLTRARTDRPTRKSKASNAHAPPSSRSARELAICRQQKTHTRSLLCKTPARTTVCWTSQTSCASSHT